VLALPEAGKQKLKLSVFPLPRTAWIRAIFEFRDDSF